MRLLLPATMTQFNCMSLSIQMTSYSGILVYFLTVLQFSFVEDYQETISINRELFH